MLLDLGPSFLEQPVARSFPILPIVGILFGTKKTGGKGCGEG